jgi:hypothetical protein
MTTAPMSTESAQELFAAIKDQFLPMQQLIKKGQEAYDDPANKNLIKWARYECKTVSPDGSPSIDKLNEVGLDRNHLPNYCIGIVVHFFNEHINALQVGDTEDRILSILEKSQKTDEDQKELISALKEVFKASLLHLHNEGNDWAVFLDLAALYLAFDITGCSKMVAEADNAAPAVKGTTKPKNGFGN